MGVSLKYKLGWTGGLVLWEKSRNSVFKGLKVTKILTRSALIESAVRWGSSTSIYRVVSSAKRRIRE